MALLKRKKEKNPVRPRLSFQCNLPAVTSKVYSVSSYFRGSCTDAGWDICISPNQRRCDLFSTPPIIILDMIITSHNSSNSPAMNFHAPSVSILTCLKWRCVLMQLYRAIFKLNGILTSPVFFRVTGSEVAFLRDSFSFASSRVRI